MISRTDVETIERLCDATMRAGHTETAIEGYALVLRLKCDLGLVELLPSARRERFYARIRKVIEDATP